MSDHKLKAHLVEAYGGFSDRRIKNLTKGDTFIVDDRSSNDVAADRSLYPYFCLIFARVSGPDRIEVQLLGEVPMSESIKDWLTANDGKYNRGVQPSLTFTLTLGQEAVLDQLAELVQNIVRPGAPRYAVASYKYMCPRTAASLRRLSTILRRFRAA